MKFSTREDIEAPAEAVFDALTDFAALERAALRRGADVRRLDRMREPGAGMRWDVGFSYRGKPRNLVGEIVGFRRPQELAYEGQIGKMDLKGAATLVRLSPSRTRLVVEIELMPRSLTARLLLQTLKLGKANHLRRLSLRLQGFAREIEARQPQRRVF